MSLATYPLVLSAVLCAVRYSAKPCLLLGHKRIHALGRMTRVLVLRAERQKALKCADCIAKHLNRLRECAM